MKLVAGSVSPSRLSAPAATVGLCASVTLPWIWTVGSANGSFVISIEVDAW